MNGNSLSYPLLKKISWLWFVLGGIALFLASVACLKFSQVVQALTMEPPLPSTCAMAEKAEDAMVKVSLYTRCLEGNDQQGRSLEVFRLHLFNGK